MLALAACMCAFLLCWPINGIGVEVEGTPDRDGKKLTWEKPKIYLFVVASDFGADVFSGEKESVKCMVDCHREKILGAIRNAQVQG